MDALCIEVESLLQHMNIPLATQPLSQLVYTIVRKTSDNYSSMHQDLQRGIATEIDYINGYLVQRAKSLQIPCPYNEMLTHLIHFKERMQAI